MRGIRSVEREDTTVYAGNGRRKKNGELALKPGRKPGILRTNEDRRGHVGAVAAIRSLEAPKDVKKILILIHDEVKAAHMDAIRKLQKENRVLKRKLFKRT